MEDIIPMPDTDFAPEEEAAVESPTSALMTPENLILPYDYQSFISSEVFHNIYFAGRDEFLTSSLSLLSSSEAAGSSDTAAPAVFKDMSPPQDDQAQADKDIEVSVKSKILHHPVFPRMLQAYTDCQKVVGGPADEMFGFLDEIQPSNNVDVASKLLGSADPEVDEFMETYCEMLEKHKNDLANTFNDASSFLNNIEMQLTDLCGSLSFTSLSGVDAEAISPEEEQYVTEEQAIGADDHQPSKSDKNKANADLKKSLLSKYECSDVNNLKQEFSKRTKKKKGKLPCESRQLLLDWWNAHHTWPYPSEADKVELTRMTGLDPKQINNWFINQRKRHWKTPPESLQYSHVDNNLCSGTVLHFEDEG